MRDSQPKLGRGLAALLGQDSASQDPARAAGQLRTLSVSEIEPNPDQPRAGMEPELLRELAASIAEQGVLQPILVREAQGSSRRYQIIAGERRWRAAQQAGLSEIPCVVRQMSDPEASAAALVENLQREDLNPLEEAEGMQRVLTRLNLTQESLARVLGKSRSHVANTLRLLNLPQSVQDALRTGLISAGHARALLSHHDPAAATRVVINRGLNVRQTEALTTSPPALEPARRPPRDPDLQAVERELTEKLGLAVSISDQGGSGRLSVRYRTLAQLDGLIAVLGRTY